MVLPVANLGAVVAQWIEAELLPKATGWQKVATIMAGVGVANNAAVYLQQYIPTMQVLGFADAEGNINIDSVHAAAKAAFKEVGKVVLPGGVIIDADDVESMFGIAKKYAKKTEV